MTRLQEIMKRAETWPEATQEEAVELLLALEEEKTGFVPLSPEDREALARSAEDVREGRLVSDEEMRNLLRRYRSG